MLDSYHVAQIQMTRDDENDTANALGYAIIALPTGIVSAEITKEVEQQKSNLKNGDQKSISIAAASIIAKTWRDRLMTLYSKIYPMYGWERNKGYGTQEHRSAIKKFGLTKIHRKSFLSNLI